MNITPDHPRIGRDRNIMNGKPCITGTRMTVETIIDLLGTNTELIILSKYPFLKSDDIKAALKYAQENPLGYKSKL